MLIAAVHERTSTTVGTWEQFRIGPVVLLVENSGDGILCWCDITGRGSVLPGGYEGVYESFSTVDDCRCLRL